MLETTNLTVAAVLFGSSAQQVRVQCQKDSRLGRKIGATWRVNVAAMAERLNRPLDDVRAAVATLEDHMAAAAAAREQAGSSAPAKDAA